MGDFYELFYDDARKASRILNIALTSRSKKSHVPMSGIPHHALDAHLERLLAAGEMVAIVEQTEPPAAARARKDVVRRTVSRLVTPGTLVEDRFLPPQSHNFVAALSPNLHAVAYLDLSTGFFAVRALDGTLSNMNDILELLSPSELVVSSPISLSSSPRLRVRKGGETDETFSDETFSDETFSGDERVAISLLLNYVRETQCGKLPPLQRIQRTDSKDEMQIDAVTRRGLELVPGRLGIDRTKSAAGARLLAQRVAAPLTDCAAIEARLDEVEWLVKRPRVRKAIARHLGRVADIERAVQRLALGRGGVRDLLAVADSLEALVELDAPIAAERLPRPHLSALRPLLTTLRAALTDEGSVREGYSAELDHARALLDGQDAALAAAQDRLRAETGLPRLRVRRNGVLGCFAEVASRASAALGERAGFELAQGTATVARFRTAELRDLETDLRGAAEEAAALERACFDELCVEVLCLTDELRAAAAVAARLDFSQALAAVAVDRGYVRPRVTDSTDFDVRDGRHPAVEAALDGAGAFVPNDCRIDDAARLWLVTGPNMGGKSTFLRQNALLAVLAQVGSFVPAAAADVGVVDRLFCRVGASDDLAADRSTFMVEMEETAAILNRATRRSLVLMDEVGRGTTTLDGLAIAAGVVEHLHDVIQCRALFATHYLELASLPLPRLFCARAEALDDPDAGVVFLHRIEPGVAPRAHGIHVARIAGMPSQVLRRAEQILSHLSNQKPTEIPPQ